MAYIIGDIAVMPRIAKRTQLLSCMEKPEEQVCKKVIYDAESVQQRINQAAKIKQQLGKDIFERNKIIEQSAEAVKQF